MSFKKSLFWALILFATVPLIIVGMVSAYFIANDLIQTRTATLEILAKNSGDSLSHIIDGQKREFKRITERNPVVNYLNFINSGINDEEQQSSLFDSSVNVLNRWITTRPNYIDIILADSQGNVISAHLSGNIGKNINDKDYFINAIQNDDVYLSNITETLLVPGSKTIAMSHAVHTDIEDKKGVIVAFFSGDFFEDFFESFSLGDTGIACLVDANGEIIYHPYKMIYSKERLKENVTADFSNIFAKYFADKTTPRTGIISYELDAEKRVLGYSVLEELNWVFIIRQSQDEITAPIGIIHSVMKITFLISLLIAAISGFILTNVFTKPLNILESSFSKAANENSYIVCQIESKNEFGHLAKSYNTMISTLSAHEEELKQNYEALKKEKEQTEFLAHYDTITGIFNRTGFIRHFETVLAPKKVTGGLFFIDLDDFKYVNDALGHNYGDRLLKQFSERLSRDECNFEFQARLGGDEFLLVKLGDYDEIEKTARQLLETFKIPLKVDDMISYTSGSIGIAFFNERDTHATTLIRNADIAMYKAKESGKNTYKFYNEEMQEAADRRNKIIGVLRDAISSKEVYMTYQPEVCIKSGKIIAFESLMRIKNKELGLISPAEFIPIAEASNLILQLGDWAINEVCAFAKKLVNQRVDFGVISVNISSVQLMHPDFVPKLLESLRLSGLPPQYFQIEITESVIIASVETIIEKLKEVRAAGITVALDDFGTGYSSFNYLINLPIDVLKIDKSFIDDIYTDTAKQIVCKTIIDMSHKLNLKVVAEGIETEQELNLLKSQGCDICQGYFFSRPVEEKEVMPLVEKFS